MLNPDFDDDSRVENIETITPDWLKDSKSYPIFYNSITKLDLLIKKISKENKKDDDVDEKKSEIAIKNKRVNEEKAIEKHENNDEK